MRRRNLIAACAAVMWAMASASAWCGEATEDRGSWEAYSIVSEINIFSRTRRPRVTATAQTVKQTPEVARTEESYLVLRGVVRENDMFTAFVEDSRTGSVQRVREGEAVGGGTLAAATLDFVSYRLGESDTRIEIGRTLGGEIPETSSSSSSGDDYYYSTQGDFDYQQTTSTVGTTVVSDDEAKDILQRLKERRKKELGE